MYVELLLGNKAKTWKTEQGSFSHTKPQLFSLRSGAAILSIYSVLATMFILSGTQVNKNRDGFQPYSPVDPVPTYEVQGLQAHPVSVFISNPSKDVDDAWIRLLSPVQIAVSKSELKKSGFHDIKNALRVSDDQYLGTMGVYHELHCLRRMFWMYHADIYFSNYTTHRRAQEKAHGIHCIEVIRRALMCRPNFGLFTLMHQEGEPQRMTTEAKRECVNWDAVDSWAMERSVGWDPTLYTD